MTDTARDALLGTFKSLLASGKYSDLVITCGSDTYNVHESVVCSRSGFLERAERYPQEDGSLTGKVDLPEDDPAMIKLLVQYLYEGTYDLPEITPGPVPTLSSQFRRKIRFITDSHIHAKADAGGTGQYARITDINPNMLLNAKMYELGDKYYVIGLQDLSRERFAYSCESSWDSDDFAPAAHYAFSTTPDTDKGLRDIVVQTVADHMGLLNKPAI
ncbi:hypothetical protein NX059_005988 [Plenodomus lindquistii]|nr:hypothetical protein NX059_005988 [Plenodomus lindquistii]